MTEPAAQEMRSGPGPFLSSVMQIEPQWIDYNGHLNMAYYNVMFDRAVDQLWLRARHRPGYMKERHGSTFTAECHVRYLREIHLGDPVQISVICWPPTKSACIRSRNCATPPRAGCPPRPKTCPSIST